MALFGEVKKPFTYDILREGEEIILLIDLEQYQHIPSLEDDGVCMSRTVDILMEAGTVTKIVYTQKRNFEYDYNQTLMIQEIAKLYSQLAKRRDLIGYGSLLADPKCTKWAAQWYATIQNITADLLKRDPIGAYVELKRTARDERIRIDRTVDQNYINCARKYIATLQYLMSLMEKTRLIDSAKQYLSGYKLGERSVYRRIFTPDIRPDFMFAKLMATFPPDGEEIDSYEIDKNTEVTIFELADNVQYLYHLIPPEFKLSEEKYEILDTARKIMAEHKPTRQEFIDPERMRQVFYNIGSDLIEELVNYRNLRLTAAEIDEITKILVRYTVGFGLIEVLLQDEKVQDITINSPLGETPMFIVHQDYADCKTNIIPTVPEADSWASKLRLISGRPLDEANPILDTELTIPGANSRIAVVAPPLNPSGLAFAFRRHRDKPWTLPLFIQNKMMNPLAAGILSFLIDGSRSLLIAGTRSAGKTSLLGAVLVELMRKYRVITIEDSVTGDCSLYIHRNGKIERTTIGVLIDGLFSKYGKWYNLTEHEVTGNPENIKIFSMDKQGKIKLASVSKFIRHKVKKPISKITTRTGRVIKVTGDHSLFGLDNQAKVTEVKANELKIGSHIAVPRFVNFNNKLIKNLELFNQLVRIPKTFFYGESIKKAISEYKKEIKYFGKEAGYGRSAIRNWFKKSFLPQQIILSLISSGLKLGNEVLFSYSNSIIKIPTNIELTEDFLTFVGLWIADGCYDKNSVIISCNDIEDRRVFDKVAQAFNLKRKIHSDGVSYMLNSKPLKIVMKECLNLQGNAYTKRIPEWAFNLSKEQISFILKGIFSGDGCPSDKELVIPLASINLLKDLQFLLSLYGINLRIGKLRKDGTYNASISTLNDFVKFNGNIGFLRDYKTAKLRKLCAKVSLHDSSDIIPLHLETKKTIWKEYKEFKYGDYIIRSNNVGRAKLSQIVELMPKSELRYNLENLANSDIFWDEIKSIEIIQDFEDFVYDISVPECESFVCENIIAHNTLELPTNSLRKLGYNIQSMKVAAALTKGSSEVPADEGIRTTLRMGDSALIIGEIRSSLRGDQDVVIVEKGLTKRVAIKNLENLNLKSIYLPTLTSEGKMELKQISGFVKHPKRNQLIKLTTKTGRSVIVTPDHSVFTHVNFKIAAINTDQLKSGDPIIIPSKIPNGFNDISYINLLEIFREEYRLENAESYIRKAIKVLGWRKASKICEIADIYRYLLSSQKTRIPIKSFLKLMQEAKIKYNIEDLRIKKGTANSIPVKFPINENVMRFIGYYLAEGNIDINKIQITNSKTKIIEDIKNICEKEFGLRVSQRKIVGYGSSIQMFIRSKPLLDLLVYLGCGKTSFHKRIPEFIYGLNKRKICALLKGMYSGDGSISSTKNAGNMIRYFSTSKKLVEDVSYALLSLGIVCRLNERQITKRGKKNLFIAEIKQRKYVEYFLKNIGFAHKNPQIVIKSIAHSEDDSVSFDPKELEKHLKLPRKYRHLRRTKHCSKDYLKKITEEVKCSNEVYDFAHGSFFVDRVKLIGIINLKKPEYVYDLEVKSTQRFIGGFGGILLHNTEALALYEAMRIGALANVVAGTIHGDSPYGVFDRVVNDLQVPRTSFKATDVIVVANPVRSADGLHRWRRITQITEVRKQWEQDPLVEKGFVDLMKYDSKKDQLEASEELINGDSEILKAIAGNVKEWAGNWDAVWDNITLRANIKKSLVDFAAKQNTPWLLEADFVIQSNDQFHKISEKVKDEIGTLDSKRILFEWNEWLKRHVKKMDFHSKM